LARDQSRDPRLYSVGTRMGPTNGKSSHTLFLRARYPRRRVHLPQRNAAHSRMGGLPPPRIVIGNSVSRFAGQVPKPVCTFSFLEVCSRSRPQLDTVSPPRTVVTRRTALAAACAPRHDHIVLSAPLAPRASCRYQCGQRTVFLENRKRHANGSDHAIVTAALPAYGQTCSRLVSKPLSRAIP